MAISKNDCMLLLTSLSKDGIDTKEELKKLVLSDKVELETLKFINDNRPLDLSNFYELLRKNYNNKKSKLYINIMKDLEEDSVFDVLTTLNAYAQQILLFSKEVDNKDVFFRFARLSEIYQCLYFYSENKDLTPSIKLLRLIKADIKALESIYR